MRVRLKRHAVGCGPLEATDVFVEVRLMCFTCMRVNGIDC